MKILNALVIAMYLATVLVITVGSLRESDSISGVLGTIVSCAISIYLARLALIGAGFIGN